jgi:hypothetical protein
MRLTFNAERVLANLKSESLTRLFRSGRAAQGVTGVRMHLKADLGLDASALDQLGQASHGERCAPRRPGEDAAAPAFNSFRLARPTG